MSESILSPEQFEELLPLAAAWAEQQEALILAAGVALSASQLSDARFVGVAQPERVRLLAVPSVPTPAHPNLRAAGEATGLISPFTAGLALRYGIYLRSDFSSDRFLVAHELVHTAQYERLGSFTAFSAPISSRVSQHRLPRCTNGAGGDLHLRTVTRCRPLNS